MISNMLPVLELGRTEILQGISGRWAGRMSSNEQERLGGVWWKAEVAYKGLCPKPETLNPKPEILNPKP